MSRDIISEIKGGIIISCQAEGDDPFNSPVGVSKFARAAEMGGAKGIRSEGYAKTKKIIQSVRIPVIGLIKRTYGDGSVCITRKIEDVRKLHDIGCALIAIDGTPRKFSGYTGPELISKVKSFLDCKIMADLSRIDEAEKCIQAGADCVSTTLSGYTPATRHSGIKTPDFLLLRKLIEQTQVPVIAEGRIHSPQQARRAFTMGAWAVVVGTAVTRPRVVTSWYVNLLKPGK